MEEIIIDILKLILAIGTGIIIGREREVSGKPAGMRTLSLVCMGATFLALVTIRHFPEETARVLAGVITGIGFLGAGVIIAQPKNVIGVTTAATIWAVAIVGIGIGLGEYIISIIFVGLVYLILIERKIERTIMRKGNKVKDKIN